MSTARIFEGGLPYGPDVHALRDAFPVAELTEGRVIGHEALERVIKQKRASSRFYGVVNSWIAHLKNEARIFMIWEAKIGLKVLGPAELLGHAETRTRQKIKQTGKAIRTFSWVDRDRLDDTGKKRLDHQARVADVLRRALDDGRKELAVELTPVKSLPKRVAAVG